MKESAKVLQFPLAGVSRDLDYRKAYIPSEQVSFATPFAKNVIGTCTFKERTRGGSRPMLKAFVGAQPTSSSHGYWLWPNGDKVLWPTNDKMLFDEIGSEIVMPDGSVMFNQHETFNVKAAKGSVPQNLTVMTMYRARLVVAKDAMWYASRLGDVTDFDYGGDADDVARAVAGNAADADRKGETITALMRIGDTDLFIATGRNIRHVVGDVVGGTVSVSSEHVGVISKDAWCYDGNAIYFIGANGLYGMISGQAPQLVSHQLPSDLKGMTSAVLVYDPEMRSIHIIGQKNGASSDWIYDTENKAFWPVEYPAAKRPSYGATAMSGGVNFVVFMCADGVWRYLDNTSTTDDGTTMVSKVAIGPIRSSERDDMDGLVAEISGMLAEGSSDVDVSVYTAHTPEMAVSLANAGTDPFSCLFSGGWNRVVRPRKRGAWCVFVLSSNGRWGYESITAVIKMLGRLR